MNKIPVFDPLPEYELLKPEINDAIQNVLNSGRFIMGPEVSEFEEAVADYLGVKHAVAVNSGTDALVLGLQAMGVQAGDEVITTAFSFFATAEAISILGGTPVFIDIDPQTFNLDVNQIENAITEKTRAILPVHLFGQAANMDVICQLALKYKLKVLEDVAQAFGGKWKGQKLGSIGDAGALSFFPTKNLGAFGDAGLITTSNDEIAEVSRMLRGHGSKQKYMNERVGYNSRMDTLQAAILNVKLPHLDEFNQKRKEVAGRYIAAFQKNASIQVPYVDPNTDHVFHQVTIRVLGAKRDHLKQVLKKNNISTMIYYPKPMHQLPVYKDSSLSHPEAEAASGEVLSLPIWPLLDKHTQSHIIETILKIAE